MHSLLAIHDLRFAHGERTILADLDLHIAPQEALVIIGTSGSGKTTLLRLIAGLERPSHGSIAIAGTVMSDARTFVRPEERPVGMIFQGLALFPHMTVAENVSFGLTYLGRPERRERVKEELAIVGLSGLEARYPHQLSGGQQQRVAIARSLVRRPALMLMDEPFSDLDPDTRRQVRSEVKRILDAHGITSIIVTHDPQDADQVADRVLVMRTGVLAEADGTLRQ